MSQASASNPTQTIPASKLRYQKLEPEEGVHSWRLSKMAADLPLPGVTKAVLRALCDRYPNIRASIDTTAKLVGFSKRSVQRSLRELTSLGIITTVGKTQGGWRWATQYKISVAEIERRVKEAKAAEKRGATESSPDEDSHATQSSLGVPQSHPSNDRGATQSPPEPDRGATQSSKQISTSSNRQVNNNTASTTDKAPTDDAGDGVSVSKSEKPSGKDEFLVRIVNMFEEESYTIHHCQKHYDAVWKQAKEIGAEKYLAAVTLYLEEYVRKDNYLGEENGTARYRHWPLDTWLKSIRRKECIDRACRVLDRFPTATNSEFLFFDAFLQRGHNLDGDSGLKRHLGLLTNDTVARLRDRAKFFGPFVSNSWYCLQQTIDGLYEDDDVDAFIQHPMLDKDEFAWVYKKMSEQNALTTA